MGAEPARLLLTGFEAFGPHASNPSERAVRRLSDAPPPGVQLSTRILPVSYREAFQPVREALDDEVFQGALLVGLGAGRQALDFERLAVNWRGGGEADNLGMRIAGEQIDVAGPAAYFSTLPAEQVVAACRAAGVAAATSGNAGTFVCNQVFYQCLRHCDRRDLACRVGFVHVPLLPEQAADGQPHMDEDAMVVGLAAALTQLAELPPPPRPDELG